MQTGKIQEKRQSLFRRLECDRLLFFYCKVLNLMTLVNKVITLYAILYPPQFEWYF